MNVLYISNLTGNLFAGPNNSVPAQIKAQSEIDHVFWYNLNSVRRDEWSKNGLDCKNLRDYPTGRLKDLPFPFCKPDLAIVEEFYCYPFCKLIHDIQSNGIPYIIIPRSEFTKQAQQKKLLKKKIGNLFYFRHMAHKAAAIQYLSQQEYIESGEKWNQRSLIIPNGTVAKAEVKKTFTKDAIQAVYIGRYEQYQKGLDILMNALAMVQSLLRENGFRLNMYGVNQEGALDAMTQQIAQYGIDDLVRLHDAVYGNEKERVLLQSDVFVMTSRFEGMPMGMIEALSYGLPCVATVGTNLSGEIAKHDAGWTAENTVESVSDALRTMVKEYCDVKRKSYNALSLATEYSWDEIAKRSHKEYLKIVEEG